MSFQGYVVPGTSSSVLGSRAWIWFFVNSIVNFLRRGTTIEISFTCNSASSFAWPNPLAIFASG